MIYIYGGKRTRRSRNHSLYSHFIYHPESHIVHVHKRPASHNITDNHTLYRLVQTSYHTALYSRLSRHTMTRPARRPISRTSCTHRHSNTYPAHVANLHLEQGDLHHHNVHTQHRHTLPPPQDITKSEEDQRRSWQHNDLIQLTGRSTRPVDVKLTIWTKPTIFGNY